MIKNAAEFEANAITAQTNTEKERVLAEAEQEAARVKSKAEFEANAITAQANTEKEKFMVESKEEAAAIITEAKNTAEKVTADATILAKKNVESECARMLAEAQQKASSIVTENWRRAQEMTDAAEQVFNTVREQLRECSKVIMQAERMMAEATDRDTSLINRVPAN
jgi:vacuolar-type H+-ATPase subunit H